MKALILQPHYSMDARDLDACFEELLALLDKCETADVIVLPEYSDVPADVPGKDGFAAAVEKNAERLLAAAKKTAVRCGAVVFVNCGAKTEGGIRNATHVIDKTGTEIARYDKAHPAPSEVRADGKNHGLDVDYSYSFREPMILTLGGVRYAFLTCYDFYFYEMYAAIAKQKPDVIIGCSLQRTDTHEALGIFCRFLCYQTNAYLLRSSVSLGENSPICGSSMAVSPKGEMLLDMNNDVGIGCVEFDPHAKFEKPAGFGGVPMAHHEYTEVGRRPWLYRPAGSMTVPAERVMGYPRVCAHRGFSGALPENTMPAFGASVALGADEIEFDVWATKDGELVVCHDPTLERCSDGTGNIWDHTLAELKALSFGTGAFDGTRIATFGEVLAKFSNTVIMNIHMKIWDLRQEPRYEQVAAALRKYDAEKHCYMMTTEADYLQGFRKVAPEVALCKGVGPDPYKVVDEAIEGGFEKAQLFFTYTPEMIAKAKAHGIRLNYCEADDPAEALKLLELGVDTIMTNNFVAVANAIHDAGYKRSR